MFRGMMKWECAFSPQNRGICTFSSTASTASLFSLEGLVTGRGGEGDEGLDTHKWIMRALLPHQAG